MCQNFAGMFLSQIPKLNSKKISIFLSILPHDVACNFFLKIKKKFLLYLNMCKKRVHFANAVRVVQLRRKADGQVKTLQQFLGDW